MILDCFAGLLVGGAETRGNASPLRRPGASGLVRALATALCAARIASRIGRWPASVLAARRVLPGSRAAWRNAALDARRSRAPTGISCRYSRRRPRRSRLPPTRATMVRAIRPASRLRPSRSSETERSSPEQFGGGSPRQCASSGRRSTPKDTHTDGSHHRPKSRTDLRRLTRQTITTGARPSRRNRRLQRSSHAHAGRPVRKPTSVRVRVWGPSLRGPVAGGYSTGEPRRSYPQVGRTLPLAKMVPSTPDAGFQRRPTAGVRRLSAALGGIVFPVKESLPLPLGTGRSNAHRSRRHGDFAGGSHVLAIGIRKPIDVLVPIGQTTPPT